MYFLFVWMMNQIFSLKFKITRYNTHITGKCAIAHLPIKKKGILFMEKNINTKELNNLLIKEKLLPNLPKGTLVFQECLRIIVWIITLRYYYQFIYTTWQNKKITASYFFICIFHYLCI